MKTRNKRYSYSDMVEYGVHFTMNDEGLVEFSGDLKGARWDGHEYKVPDGGWRLTRDTYKDGRIVGVDGLSNPRATRRMGLADSVCPLMARIFGKKLRIHRVSGQIVLPKYKNNEILWEAREDFINEIWNREDNQIDGLVDSNVFAVSRDPHMQVLTSLKVNGAIIVPAGPHYLDQTKRNAVQAARKTAEEEGVPFDYHREFGATCGTCPVTILYLNPRLVKDKKMEFWIKNKILLTKSAVEQCSGGNKTTVELADIYRNLRNVGLQVWEDAYRG